MEQECDRLMLYLGDSNIIKYLGNNVAPLSTRGKAGVFFGIGQIDDVNYAWISINNDDYQFQICSPLNQSNKAYFRSISSGWAGGWNEIQGNYSSIPPNWF